MKDKLKLRIWDKEHKQMHIDDFIVTSLGKIHRPEVASLEMAEIKGNLDELAYRWLKFDQAEEVPDSLIVTKCTGLKDRNGNLAYINDLICFDDGLIGVIKQIDDVNSIEYGRIIVIPIFCIKSKHKAQYAPTVIIDSEIIGNIYENEGLLENEK